MGTTTFFLRMNDMKKPLSEMSKEELEALDNLRWEPDTYINGWRSPMELHNGNIYSLIFWRGRLMQLEEAPKLLDKKYYDRRKGTTRKEYEWTLLKRHLMNSLMYLDKEFKKTRRKKLVKDSS
jgi:hypothetical protein